MGELLYYMYSSDFVFLLLVKAANSGINTMMKWCRKVTKWYYTTSCGIKDWKKDSWKNWEVLYCDTKLSSLLRNFSRDIQTSFRVKWLKCSIPFLFKNFLSVDEKIGTQKNEVMEIVFEFTSSTHVDQNLESDGDSLISNPTLQHLEEDIVHGLDDDLEIIDEKLTGQLWHCHNIRHGLHRQIITR